VWSTAWIRNPRAELEAIERAIRNARAMPREAAAFVVPLPETPPQTQTATRQAEGARSVTSAAEQPLLATYVETDLRRFPPGKALQEESAARGADLVAAVVSVEGPVHVDVVVERIRSHYRLQRAGRRVRDAVERGLTEALRRGTVTWLPLLVTRGKRSEFLVASVNHALEPRGPLSDGTVRDVEHVCDQEIEAAVVRVVRAMVGAAKDEVITATARAFGYARTGEHVEGRMSKGVDRLLATQRLVERVGSLVVRD